MRKVCDVSVLHVCVCGRGLRDRGKGTGVRGDVGVAGDAGEAGEAASTSSSGRVFRRDKHLPRPAPHTGDCSPLALPLVM